MGSWRVVAEEAVAKDYLLDIADDGYVISAPVDCGAEEREIIRQAVCSGILQFSAFTSKLDECTDPQCACSRDRNPAARRLFMDLVVEKMVAVSKGKDKLSYASFGCGLLRFDFELLERLLAANVPVTEVHLVDSMYAKDADKPKAHAAALAQFAGWFGSSVDIFAYPSVEKFAFLARKNDLLPIAVLQVDCAELTGVFDSMVKPALEEVLHYGGLFLALNARGSTGNDGGLACNDAWGEVWRLNPEIGRMRLASKIRYSVAEQRGIELGESEELPPAVAHSGPSAWAEP